MNTDKAINYDWMNDTVNGRILSYTPIASGFDMIVETTAGYTMRLSVPDYKLLRNDVEVAARCQ